VANESAYVPVGKSTLGIGIAIGAVIGRCLSPVLHEEGVILSTRICSLCLAAPAALNMCSSPKWGLVATRRSLATHMLSNRLIYTTMTITLMISIAKLHMFGIWRHKAHRD